MSQDRQRPKPTQADFRRRRITALVVLAVVVVLIVWGISAIAGAIGGSDGAEPEVTETAAAEPTSSAHPTSAETTEDAAPEPDPTPEPDPGPVPCTPATLLVEAAADKWNYAPEEQPQLTMTITNTSDAPCMIDVGTAKQEYRIVSGSDQIWVSTHCLANPEESLVQIEAGQSVSSAPISWVRERSAPDTCEAERPRAVGGGAYYQLIVTVDGIESEPTTFVLD